LIIEKGSDGGPNCDLDHATQVVPLTESFSARIRQSSISRFAARSRGARSGSAATLSTTQHLRTDVAQLAAPVPAEQRNVPELVDQTGHERVTGTPISPT
jgi:hypothetical protein